MSNKIHCVHLRDSSTIIWATSNFHIRPRRGNVHVQTELWNKVAGLRAELSAIWWIVPKLRIVVVREGEDVCKPSQLLPYCCPLYFTSLSTPSHHGSCGHADITFCWKRSKFGAQSILYTFLSSTDFPTGSTHQTGPDSPRGITLCGGITASELSFASWIKPTELPKWARISSFATFHDVAFPYSI
jgi:hypothetical protein